MTRVNSEQLKHVPWFAKAGAACSIVPITRFVNDHIFALKGGGYAPSPYSFCQRLGHYSSEASNHGSIQIKLHSGLDSISKRLCDHQHG